jgi:hypothetical protein
MALHKAVLFSKAIIVVVCACVRLCDLFYNS